MHKHRFWYPTGVADRWVKLAADAVLLQTTVRLWYCAFPMLSLRTCSPRHCKQMLAPSTSLLLRISHHWMSVLEQSSTPICQVVLSAEETPDGDSAIAYLRMSALLAVLAEAAKFRAVLWGFDQHSQDALASPRPIGQVLESLASSQEGYSHFL